MYLLKEIQLTLGFTHLTISIKPKILAKIKTPVKFTMAPFIWFTMVLAVYWPIYSPLNTFSAYYSIYKLEQFSTYGYLSQTFY